MRGKVIRIKSSSLTCTRRYVYDELSASVINFQFFAMIHLRLNENLSIQVEYPTPLQCQMGDQLYDISSYGGQSFFSDYNEYWTDSVELSSDSTILMLLDREKFEFIADSDHINRNQSYDIGNVIDENFLQNDYALSVGDKALLYLYQLDYRIYENFWYAFETCKICKGQSCDDESIDIINGACAEETPLATFVKTPVSASADINDFIGDLVSEYNFQLFEFTLFKFPNEDYVTISCDIRLTPKQEIEDYKLSNAYGPCSNPLRTGFRRRKRSEAEITHLTISATQRISQEETYQQDSEKTFQKSSYTVHLMSSVILLLLSSV